MGRSRSVLRCDQAARPERIENRTRITACETMDQKAACDVAIFDGAARTPVAAAGTVMDNRTADYPALVVGLTAACARNCCRVAHHSSPMRSQQHTDRARTRAGAMSGRAPKGARAFA